MQLSNFRTLFIGLVCGTAVLVIANVRAQRSSQTGFAAPPSTLRMQAPSQTPAVLTRPKEKTVEQTQKNIKVLSGMPESQLLGAMELFETSLGVECAYCHVNKNNAFDFASDDKPQKATAREMIKLVTEVNENAFRGEAAVSCYTCHRAQTSPQSLPLCHWRHRLAPCVLLPHR